MDADKRLNASVLSWALQQACRGAEGQEEGVKVVLGVGGWGTHSGKGYRSSEGPWLLQRTMAEKSSVAVQLLTYIFVQRGTCQILTS